MYDNTLSCLNVYLPSLRLGPQQFKIWFNVCLEPHLHLSFETLPHNLRFTFVGKVSMVELSRNFIVPLGRLYIYPCHVASVCSSWQSSKYFPCFMRFRTWFNISSFSLICTKDFTSALTSSINFAVAFDWTSPPRARKSMVSWYPGYQPMSNLAANFGWAEGTDSHHLRINSQ